MSEEKQSKEDRYFKWLLIGVGVLLLGSIIWSMIFETLLPLVRDERWLDMWLHIIAMPLVLVATGVIGWGGLVFVRDTFRAMGDAELVANVEDIQAGKGTMDQRWANARFLFRSWRRGTLIMVLGFVLMAIAGFLANAVRVLGL